MDFREFFVALTSNMVSLLSGAGSVALLMVGLTWFANKPIPRWIVLFVAAVCFFVASVRVWTTEHQATITAQNATMAVQKKLDDLNKPQFVPSVEQVVEENEKTKNASIYFLDLTLTNLGAPSSVYAWRLNIKSPTLNISNLFPTEIVDGYTVKNPQGKVVARFDKSNRLEEKTISPLAHNGFVAGWLRFDVPNVGWDLLDRTDTQLTLQVYDVNQQVYSAPLTGAKKRAPLVYIPGSGDNPYAGNP